MPVLSFAVNLTRTAPNDYRPGLLISYALVETR